MPVTPTVALILASSLVLAFHALDILSHRLRVPSVLLLMGMGSMIGFGLPQLGISFTLPSGVLSGLGLLGLALIVLEGAMGLELHRDRLPATFQASLAAIAGMLLFLVPSTLLIHHGWGISWHVSLLNAIPFSVLSSAIAIPSAARLSPALREFVAIESSLSDILGVLLFNAVALPQALGIGTVWRMTWSGALVLVLSVVVVGGVLKLLKHSTHKVRFMPLLAILVLFFSSGKLLHLPSLVLVFLFGVAMANIGRIPFSRIRTWLVHDDFQQDAHLLETLVTELAFLVRTFFFFLFGFSLEFGKLLSWKPWAYGGVALVLVYLCRFLVLKPLVKEGLRPLLSIAPRGLITILLLGMIPAGQRVEVLATGAVLVVILGTTLGQMFGGSAVTQAAGIRGIDEILPIGPQRRP